MTWLDRHKTIDQKIPANKLFIKTLFYDQGYALHGYTNLMLRLGPLIELVIDKDEHNITEKLEGIINVL